MSPNHWVRFHSPDERGSITSSSSSIVICSDSMVRFGAMAKLFRNLKAFFEGLAGTSLKSSGAGSGIRYSSATKAACSNSEWMRLSTVIIKIIRVIQAITSASTFLANILNCWKLSLT